METAISRFAAGTPRVQRPVRDPWLVGACVVAVIAVGVLGIGWFGSRPVTTGQKFAGTWAKLPSAARDLISRDIGARQSRFLITRTHQYLIAHGTGFSATFRRGGVQVRGAPGVALRLGLSAIGRGDSLAPTAAVAPAGSANIVSYQRSGIREWYANGPLGLEQGFTLIRRVSGHGELTLEVGRLPSGARATIAAGGTALTIHGAGEALRYTGLSVLDADGHRLPASLRVSGAKILLRVADAKGRYPLLVDPTVEWFGGGATLSDTSGGVSFGHAVAMSEDARTVVVGAPWSGGGAAYVFTQSPTAGWQAATQTTELMATSPVFTDDFGASVAISQDGGTIAVGVPGRASREGAVDVFSEPATGGWKSATQTAELTASDAVASAPNGSPPGDQLGGSVAISSDGSTIVAGAASHSTDGAVYVFSKPTSGGWQDATQTAELTASQGQVGDSVAISDNGTTIVTSEQNAAYVFDEPTNAGWQNSSTQSAKLTDSNQTSLGWPVAISGDGNTIAVRGSSGISVFAKQASTRWQNSSQAAELTSTCDPLSGPIAISSDGSAIVSGTEFNGPSDGEPQTWGAGYEFLEPTTGGWQSETQSAQFDDTFGCANGRYLASTAGVAISGDGGTVVVGSANTSDGPVTVFPPLPVSSSLPTVAGSAIQGQTLTETHAAWSSNPTGYSYQWENCDAAGQNCAPIPGANLQSYTLQDVDAGSTIEVEETASNVTGTGSTVSSAATGVVQPLTSTSPPTISGRALQGQTLTETNASWNSSVDGYVYQWQRCGGTSNCSDINGANNQSYTLTNADAGNTIVVEEQAYNAGGFGTPVTSGATGVVIPLVPASSKAPTISGTVVEGDSLSASILPWTNTPTATSYQWEDCDATGQTCQPIAGATAQTYTLTASDVGSRIVVTETASNAGGSSAPAVSAPTAAVPESGPVGLGIDNGDYATNDPNISVQPVWPAGTQSILISDDGGFRTNVGTFAPARSISWKLLQTGNDRLPKTVYVRFLGVGQDDINFTDEIILDETAPTVQTATISGAGTTSQASAAKVRKLRSYRLRLKASDRVVGVCEVATNQRRASAGEALVPLTSCKVRGILKVSATLKLKLRSRPRYVRVRNSAGDWSRWIAVT